MPSGRAQSKVCYVVGNGAGGWSMSMIMPDGKPLERQLTLQNIFTLQEQLSVAARDLSKTAPEKYFQK